MTNVKRRVRGFCLGKDMLSLTLESKLYYLYSEFKNKMQSYCRGDNDLYLGADAF